MPFSRTDGRGRQEQILAVLHEPAAMVIKSAHLVKIQIPDHLVGESFILTELLFGQNKRALLG